jgi:hypothetical protein
MDHNQFIRGLRALNDSLGPQAAAAGGKRAADAVFLVLFEIITAAAGGAGGKIEFLEPPAKGDVIRPIPETL